MFSAKFLCACAAILSGAVESFLQPYATRHLSLLMNNERCKRPAGNLYNFLDDYKSNADEEGGISGSGDFPPAICPQEIHRIRFSTTAGDFTIRLDLALSPSVLEYGVSINGLSALGLIYHHNNILIIRDHQLSDDP